MPQTSSTQEEARALAARGCAHGTVVVATTQTGGRGRRGRSWLSGPHGLWMSMVLRTSLPMARAPRLPLAACVAVRDVVTAAGSAPVSIKWPNDVLVPSTSVHPVLGPFCKAGGLLIEAVDVKSAGDGGARLLTSILGVGLNLWRPRDGFPADLGGVAGVLFDGDDRFVGGPDDDVIARERFRLDLAQQLQARFARLEDDVDDDAFAGVRQQLKQHSATLGRRVSVDGVSGRAVDLQDDGALVIEGDDGRVCAVHAGDVAVVGGSER